jgi:hypothetical protein
MVHACETLHEVANLFPFVVVAFEEVCAVLNRDNDSTAIANFRLGRQGEEDAGSKGDDRCNRGLRRRFVFVMTEGAGVENAVCALVVGNGLVAKVDCGLGGAGGELLGILVDIIEVVLLLLALWYAEERRYMHRI